MKLKQLFILTIFLLSAWITGNAQTPIKKFYDNAYYQGYWSGWCTNWAHELFLLQNDIICVEEGYHPSAYIVKVSVGKPYVDSDKKSKKSHKENDIWYEYTGTIYIRKPKNLSIDKWLCEFPHMGVSNNHEEVRYDCILRIAPYKKYPTHYAIWFNNNKYALAFEVR